MKKRSSLAAFTLIEVMLSMSVLAIIMMVSVNVISQTQKTWSEGSARSEQFREARVAFDVLTSSIGQATLNNYTSYIYANGTTVPTAADDAPTGYVRHSELQFISGSNTDLLTSASASTEPGHGVFFQAPLGLSKRAGYEGLKELLCGRGFFVTYGDDAAWRPPHVTQSRNRFRLMEYRPSAEENQIYSTGAGEWFKNCLVEYRSAGNISGTNSVVRPVADNILALIITPMVPSENLPAGRDATWIAPNYFYDSREVKSPTSTDAQGTQHLLPPIVHVTLIAIDEASAQLLENRYGATPPAFIGANQFTNAANLEQDIKALETRLSEEQVSFRVFSSQVMLRNAKWRAL